MKNEPREARSRNTSTGSSCACGSRAHSDPYNDAVLPEAPADMVAELSRRYIEIYEQLTGETFTVDQNENPLSRMEKNLQRVRHA